MAWSIFAGILLASFAIAPATDASARPELSQPLADAYGLIDAVNSLRASQGLPAYAINSTLMGTAQAQAEYMASTGNITHTGPGGTRPYQRALAAGYPLAGQIPPGFFSENILGRPDSSPAAAVQIWTGDDPHMNTMTSPMLQEIGAGVAESGGQFYFVIDCARPTGSGLPPAYTPGAESSFNTANEIIVPVTLSTPDSDGAIVHEVQSGQSLWQIAIAYGVKIDQIRTLNTLATAYLINPGDTLLIKRVGTATSVPATPTLTALIASSPPIPTATSLSTQTPTPTAMPRFSRFADAGGAVGAIVLVALAAAGLVAWAGRARQV